MIEQLYDVYFSGRIVEGHDREQVRQAIGNLFIEIFEEEAGKLSGAVKNGGESGYGRGLPSQIPRRGRIGGHPAFAAAAVAEHSPATAGRETFARHESAAATKRKSDRLRTQGERSGNPGYQRHRAVPGRRVAGR